MVHVDLDTPYMTLFKDFLAKKHRLATDAWGADDQYVRHVYDPLMKLITEEAAPKPEHQHLYPWPVWKLSDRVGRLARNSLVAEFLVVQWAEHFTGKDEAELDAIAKSFLFENCLKREGLNKVLTENATLVASQQ